MLLLVLAPARAGDPPAEGEPTREENRVRLARYHRRPPFAFNLALIRAARKWSAVMRGNDVQASQPGLFTAMQLEGYDVRLAGQLINGRAQDELWSSSRPRTRRRLRDRAVTRRWVPVGRSGRSMRAPAAEQAAAGRAGRRRHVTSGDHGLQVGHHCRR